MRPVSKTASRVRHALRDELGATSRDISVWARSRSDVAVRIKSPDFALDAVRGIAMRFDGVEECAACGARSLPNSDSVAVHVWVCRSIERGRKS